MKKLGFLALALSLSAFTVGCGSKPADKPAGTTSPATDTGTGTEAGTGTETPAGDGEHKADDGHSAEDHAAESGTTTDGAQP